jgi:CpeS-like protein.
MPVASMDPARTMEQFLAASRGAWLTRRAVHHLDHQDDESGNSNLVIEPFSAEDPAVEQICLILKLSLSWQREGPVSGGKVI